MKIKDLIQNVNKTKQFEESVYISDFAEKVFDIPYITNSKAQTQNKFNDMADELGCRARIGGTRKHIKFFEFRGSYSKGYEVWFPIDQHRFSVLTNKYPQLEDL